MRVCEDECVCYYSFTKKLLNKTLQEYSLYIRTHNKLIDYIGIMYIDQNIMISWQKRSYLPFLTTTTRI